MFSITFYNIERVDSVVVYKTGVVFASSVEMSSGTHLTSLGFIRIIVLASKKNKNNSMMNELCINTYIMLVTLK